MPEDLAHNLKVLIRSFLFDGDQEKGCKEIDRTVKKLPALTAELERNQILGFQKMILCVISSDKISVSKNKTSFYPFLKYKIIGEGNESKA